MENQITKRFRILAKTSRKTRFHVIFQLETKYEFYPFSIVPPSLKKEPSQKHFGRLCKDSPRTSLIAQVRARTISFSYCSKYRPPRPDKIWQKLNKFKRCNRAIARHTWKIEDRKISTTPGTGSGALKHGNRFVK